MFEQNFLAEIQRKSQVEVEKARVMHKNIKDTCFQMEQSLNACQSDLVR